MGFFSYQRFSSQRGNFTSRGEDIYGQFLFPQNGDSPFPLAILCHGMGTDHRAMKPCAEQIVRKGVATFIFDLPGHGESGGVMRGDIAPEVNAAYHKVVAHPWVDRKRIALVGHSLGAMGVIHALPELDNICAAVILSCPPDEKLSEEDKIAVYARHHLEREGRTVFEYPQDGLIPGFSLFMGVFSWLWMRVRDYRMCVDWEASLASRTEHSLLTSLQNGIPCPLLWVTCGEDRRVSAGGVLVLLLYQSIPKPRTGITKRELLYAKGFHSTPLLPGKVRRQWISWLVNKLNYPTQDESFEK